MVGKRRLIAPVVVFMSFAALPGGADTAYLLQSQSPGTLDPLTLSIRVVGGYETGYVPDAMAAVELGFGILDNLHLAASIVGAYLTDLEQLRLASYSVSPHLGLWRSDRGSSVSAYLELTHAVGAPVIVDYPGPRTDVGSVISPRADVGLDLGGGVTGLLSSGSGPASPSPAAWECPWSAAESGKPT